MKYSINNEEGEFEPGSENKVLKNKLGITSVQDMNDAEDDLLFQLYNHVFEPELSIDDLTFETISTWHHKWLGNVYGWAGELRTVNMSKGGFSFAGAVHLPKLVAQFEQDYLSKFNDLEDYSEKELVQFLAASHVEFILIHPFREGNGRISRLLMDVMATQAGNGPLDYSLMEKHKDYYFKSIQAGVAEDYQPLERLLTDVLKQSNL
jgi:cell filamentation protein